ncbi:MAG: hypothetical protein GXY44_05705 [Phycisphaerales bacterium]|nr:hypothetical protein [Phycisphaerales bacterium]
MSWFRVWAFLCLLLGTSALPAISRSASAQPPMAYDRAESVPTESASEGQPPIDADNEEKSSACFCVPQVDVWDGPTTRLTLTGAGQVLIPTLMGIHADCPSTLPNGGRHFITVCRFPTGPTARYWLANRYPHAPPGQV